MSKPVIELHPAHVWDCDNCGTENFCRSVVAELSEDEREELDQLKDFASFGYWMTVPAEVICSNCGMEYSTEDSRGTMGDGRDDPTAD